MGFQIMTKRFACMYAIAVSSPVLADTDDSAILKITDNLLYSTLGNPHLQSNIPKSCIRVPRQEKQHVAMVTEYCPIAH